MTTEAANRTDHDRLFKELFHTFFIEFVELFFPKLAKLMDKDHIVFLVQEVFTDIIEGEKNVVDILVQTRLKDIEGYVLVHVENQASRETNFNSRMYKYFCRLHEKHGPHIIPIAVFSHESITEEPDTYKIEYSFLKMLNFKYLKLHLKRERWKNYIKSNNPVAAALLTKMYYTPKESIKVKVEIARMIANLQLDPARAALILTFSDTYIKLDDKQQEVYENLLQKELNPTEVEKYMQFTTYYHEAGRKEGIKEGKADIIIKTVIRKFGTEAKGLREKLLLLTPEVLDDLNYEVFSSITLEQFLLQVSKKVPRN